VFHFLEHGHCLEQGPWREDARLSTVLCRCTGYQGIVAAVAAAAAALDRAR